ncbi:alpha/beta fold hydrolase [Azospirillum halopraeferens]|uniref:alpha/beta fold hydrolase n=1 Tax=Azospirillum halopraeferens TaxID=34010 RepID=UPI0004051503|nr:alpha/beta hydrolase [Azospirillum halopraeferens]
MTLRIQNRRLEHRWIPGDAAAPTLVFLHEGLGSVSLWRDFPDKVAAGTGCPVLIYGRAGHGHSDPADGPRGVDYQHREALDILPQVLDHFRIHEPILIGHSDGASIALIHAGGSGRPVRGLILEAPHVFVEEETLAGIRTAVEVWNASDLPERLARHHDDAGALFDAWSGIWLSPEFRPWNIEEYLPGIAAPVLVIQGEDDEYATLAQVDAIARRVSGPAETLVLPNCRHSPHRDQQQTVLRAMVNFIRRLMRSDAPAA